VRKLVFKSSAHYYGAEQDDPAFFTEEMQRPHPAPTSLERDILEAEAAVADFAERSPGVSVTIERFSNVLGPDVQTSFTRLFGLPVVPMILGFDPRCQFVHEDDVVGALAHVVEHDLPGIFNVAGDGVLALSEVAGLLGKRPAPVLPPWGTGPTVAALRRLGLRLPPEMLGQLRFGRGLDNRRLRAAGFSYRFTTRESVLDLAEQMRLQPILRGAREPFHYEQEVEDFLRRSPNVSRPEPVERGLSSGEIERLRGLLDAETGASGGNGSRGSGGGGSGEASAPGAPIDGYDDLKPREIASLLSSLEEADLAALAEHERAGRARPEVVTSIEAAINRRASGSARRRTEEG